MLAVIVYLLSPTTAMRGGIRKKFLIYSSILSLDMGLITCLLEALEVYNIYKSIFGCFMGQPLIAVL